MPTIPTYDNYQVPLRAAGFQPTTPRDFTRELPGDPGALATPLARASAAAMKMQQQVDETRVLDAMTQLRRYAVERRVGDNGFLKLKGQEALLPDDDGRGLAEREDRNLQEYGKSLVEGFSPSQMRLFSRRAQDVYREQYGFALQHVFEENERYDFGTRESAANEAINDIALFTDQPDVVADRMKVFNENVDYLAGRLGFDVNQTREYRTKWTDKLAESVVARARLDAQSDPSSIYRAQNFLEDHRETISAAASVRLGDQVKAQIDANTVNASNEKFRARIQAEGQGTGQLAYAAVAVSGGGRVSPDRVRPAAWQVMTHGIIPQESGGRQFSTDAGGVTTPLVGRYEDGSLPPEGQRAYGLSQVQTANAKWIVERTPGMTWSEDAFKNNAEYNRQVGVLWFEHLTRTYGGDLTKAIAAYHNGETEVNNAVKAAEKAGDAGNWLAHLGPRGQRYVSEVQARIKRTLEKPVTDAQGRRMSLGEADYFTRSRQWRTIDEMRREINAEYPETRTNYTLEQSLLNGRINEQRNEMSDYDLRMKNTVNALVDQAMSGQALDQTLLASLPYDAQRQFMTAYSKRAAGDASGDEALAAKVLANDDLLYSLTEANMKTISYLVPEDKGRTIREKWYARQSANDRDQNRLDVNRIAANNGGPLDPTYIVDAGRIKTALSLAMPQQWADMKPEERDAMVAMLSPVLWSAAQKDGREIKKAEEIMPWLQRQVRDIIVAPGLISPGQSALTLGYGDLTNRGPADARPVARRIAQAVRAANGQTVGDVSDDEVLMTAKQILLGMTPTVDIEQLGLARNVVDYVRGKFAQRGREPTTAELLRGYLYVTISGEKVPEEERPPLTAEDIATDAYLGLLMGGD